jgi:hypothetical protein
MTVQRARIVLDLDLAGTPVTGELAIAGGQPRPFSGYAGLIAAVAAIRDDARRDGDDLPSKQ